MSELKDEKDLKYFEEHCQNIGVQIYKAVKKNGGNYWKVVTDREVREAVKALVNHSLKMMDK